MNIYLASNSPRRKAILSFLGLDFSVLKINSDETFNASEPVDICKEISEKKMIAAKQLLSKRDISESLVVVADTLVFYDEMPLGKPKDKTDAKRMLRLLSGRSHKVITSIGCSLRGEDHYFHDQTHVSFINLSDNMIDFYLDKGTFQDKAGAYGIQSEECFFVESIKGSFSNVVGFPIELFRSKMEQWQLI